MRAGQLTASVFATGTALNTLHVSACPDAGPACALGEVPPYLHDQDVTVGELRALLELGLTPNLGVEAQLPVRVVRSAITYRRLDGTPFTPANADLHHRNETLAGPGDGWLSGRAAWSAGALGFSGRLGITLPLGRTEENPFALGSAGISHQHVQFGTGTFNVLAGADAAWSPGPWSVRGYGQAQWVPTANARGYQAGNRLGAGLLAEWTTRPLQVSAGVDVVSEAPERWDGVVQQDGNVGRTDLLVGAGAAVLLDNGRWGLTARVPVYQWYARSRDPGERLTYPLVLQVAWTRGFGLQ